MEASFSLDVDDIGWRPSKTTRETLRERVIVRQFARPIIGILAGSDPELDTTNTENDSEMKKEADERKLHRMAKVHKFLKMLQGSQNLRANQEESHAHDKQMTAVGYIPDPEEVVKASWSHFQHDGAAAFTLSERSPLPPPMFAKDVPGGQTQVLNIRRIQGINRHPVEGDEDSAPESISDTEGWLQWNGDLDNPNDSEDDCASDVDSDIEQDDSIEDLGCAEEWDVSAMPNVPGSIRPAQKSKSPAEMLFMTVNVIGTRRNKGVNTK